MLHRTASRSGFVERRNSAKRSLRNPFTTGQRNIFRQSWQRRADVSLLKTTKLTDQFSLKYSLDVFNLTNTPSFDIPLNEVEQNPFFNPFPVAGTPVNPTSCDNSNTGFYACPGAYRPGRHK